MKITRWALGVGGVLLAFSGCTSNELVVAALRIEILDARTGAPAAYDAVVVVRDGDYVETVRASDEISPQHRDEVRGVTAAENRIGVFDITITHPQYQTWRREGVRVEASGRSTPLDNTPISRQVDVLAELLPLDD